MLRRGRVLAAVADRAHQALRADEHQEDRTGPAHRGAQVAGEPLADQQPDDRHPALEGAENHADLYPDAGGDAGHANGDGGGQVSQPDRDRREQKRDHDFTITGKKPA